MAPTVQEAADFDFIIDLIYERARIRLHEGKQALIRARLGKRMRFHGCETLHDYCELLRNGAGEEEITQVVDALTTNFTSFLRERDHFDFLVKEALPSVLSPGQRRMRVWSAACATGEEPYSIGFYLSEHFPLKDGWDWQILASDISTRALKKAQDGIYPADRLTGVPPEWLRRYFQRGQGKWEGHFRIKPALRERVRFEHLSLLSEFRFDQPFEVIFCRNVMIYFDRQTQQDLVAQLLRWLVRGGFLLTGHSESLNGQSSGLRCLRPSVYQKV